MALRTSVKMGVPALEVVVLDLVFVQRLALDLERIHRRKVLVQRVRYVFVQKVVEHDVLGLSGGKLRGELRQSFQYRRVDDRLHGLRRKSE